jgi:Tol biopolymer transport system component
MLVSSPSSELRSLLVEAVSIEIGIGSPILVDVLVSGTWPDPCAQLAQLEQRFSRQRIEISLLAYGAGIEQEYFTSRGGQPDASLAKGIMGVDLDTGSTSELVKPERGYALYTPLWSPDVCYLGFDELLYFEGRGPFAYYDFTDGEYIAWEYPIGTHVWSPDGSQLAYDRLTYAPNGEERIFLKGLQSSEAQQFSPDLPSGYAYSPVFSLQGNSIAHLAAIGGPDDPNASLYIQDLAGGESRDLSSFESVWELQWMPDGIHLIFSAGPYETRQMLRVNSSDGSVTVLAQGHSPDLAGK